jgi:RNA polymerase sigma factor (sigma-70 family)
MHEEDELPSELELISVPPTQQIEVETLELAFAVDRVWKTLNPRAAIILKEYFGFDGARRTGRQIAEDLKLSEARVSQIKRNALRKLRVYHPSLADFLFAK